MKIFCILILFIFYVRKTICDSCNNFATCGECIGYGEDKCLWCSEVNLTTSRCQSEEFLRKTNTWCKKEHVYNPNNRLINIEDRPLGSKIDKFRSVQFSPQKMHFKIRPGTGVSFNMIYQPKDVPLDVYYLIDHSYNMRTYMQALRKQATYVYQRLSKFTNNLQFGHGGFIKNEDINFVNSRAPYNNYSQKNLSLASDTSIFEDDIREDITSLEALMHVMACNKKFVWRPNSRRIIVLFTNALFYSAGDGNMMGAVNHYHIDCHSNSSNDRSQKLDYPSVSQVNKMATDGNFVIIFATPRTVRDVFITLAKQISGARYAKLTDNFNILAIIISTYLNSPKHLVMTYKWPPYVQLTLDPDCTINDRCKVEHKQSMSMKGTIKVNYCPTDTTVLDLAVGPTVAELQDKLKIKLEIDCQCECEKDKSVIKNSPMCSNSGTYQCGICKCNSERTGNTCQIDNTITSASYLDLSKHDINSTNLCNGRGIRKFGKCQCNAGFSGYFCEFDDHSCKGHNKELCSGNGICTLGKCVCDMHWYGEDCSCSSKINNCFAPYSKEICSGNGNCFCNQCVCPSRTVEGKIKSYSGVFCEDCEDCAEKRCKELEDYAYCNFMNNKTKCDKQTNTLFNTDVKFVNKVEISPSKWPTAKWCQKSLDDNTTIVFLHDYDKATKKMLLIIQKETEMPPEDNYVSISVTIWHKNEIP